MRFHCSIRWSRRLPFLHCGILRRPARRLFAIGWGWGGNGNFLDACEIQVERAAAAGFALLAQDTTPGYTDTAPFPAAPAKWSYRAIYRVGDAQVGVWSNVVSVTVGG